MMTMVYIFIGGGVGSVLRWAVGEGFKSLWSHPYAILGGTLVANLLACLILGYVLAKAPQQKTIFLLAVGLCGGFSTFSTFSNEVLNLLKQGEFWLPLSYVVLSVAMGLGALFLGAKVA
ncbi:CrcB family protein [Schleiferiaceae bacterium]|jgi:CrcB protein|nr:CrcB family protein [Schleiferiaceae bacterium]MDA9151300.1 CrcB family protein [Schleiferiaceae bacterium]